MNKYSCPSCNTEWEINDDNGLLPSNKAFAAVGYWSNVDPDPQNCPECEHRTDYNLPVWLWVTERKE